MNVNGLNRHTPKTTDGHCRVNSTNERQNNLLLQILKFSFQCLNTLKYLLED